MRTTLRHLSFFEELSRLNETDDAWREISAGLVVLRLVDRWLEEGASVVASDSWGLTSVLSAVDEIPEGRPARGMLRSVVEAMVAAGSPNFRTVAPRLMAYARALDFDAKWSIGVDVYHTVIGHSDPIQDADTVIAAHLRLGYCLRQIGEIDQSAAAYGIAGRLAEQMGDMMGVLRSRLGDAKIAIARGNLPRAEIILDETIDASAKNGLPVMESLALHERASTAGLRGDYELAITLAYRALPAAETIRSRDRILHDIATAFYRLGVRGPARDAFMVILATSQEQYLRWSAGIQLMTIAADEGSGPAFERYRRELSGQRLPPQLQAEFELSAGRGYLALDDFEGATSWLERAVATANENGLNQTAFEADSDLVEARSRRRRAERTASLSEFEPAIGDVAEALRELRVTVGARGT